MKRSDNLPPGDGTTELPDGGFSTGVNPNDKAAASDFKRGFMEVADPDTPPQFLDMGNGEILQPGSPGEMRDDQIPNFERMVYDEKEGRYVDRFHGGFLPRDGFSRER